MKSILLVASTIFAGVQCGVINARQRPITSRPVPGGGGGTDVGKCGLDAFEGHTAEASMFCSSILRGGTATATETYTSRRTSTVKTTITTTLTYGPTRSSTRVTPTPTPSSTRVPTSTRTPTPTPSSTRTPTPTPPTSTRTPTPSPTPSSTRTPTPTPPTSTSSSAAPTPTGAGCGLVGYTKTTSAYFFDSTGTKNTFDTCSAFCKSETKCKSFGYGEANCMLFDVVADDNVNYNPMSPYTFYNKECPVELPVKHKRQINISLPLLGGPADISSACSCLITSAPGQTTRTTTVTVTSDRVTVTQTATRTISRGLGGDDDWDRKA